MPIIIQGADGRSFGPGQRYGYQGQYQGQRQPGINQANNRDYQGGIGSLPSRIGDLPSRYRRHQPVPAYPRPRYGPEARIERQPLPSWPGPERIPKPSWPTRPLQSWPGPDLPDFDDIMRRLETTTPEGYMSPDRYGRSRPTLPNPYEGVRIGGGWDEAAVDPSDWRVLQQILGAGGNPDDYLETAMGPNEGIMQMAELTEDQMNMMGNPLNTPDFGVSKEDLWNRTKGMEDKGGLFGWGAQEPTTREEFEDYYRQLQAGTAGNWVT